MPVPDGRMGAAGFVAADSIGVECGFVFGGVDGSGGGGGAMGDIVSFQFILSLLFGKKNTTKPIYLSSGNTISLKQCGYTLHRRLTL